MRPLLISAAAAAVLGCATTGPTPVENAGNELARGFLTALEKDGPKTIDTLMKATSEGVREELLSEATNEKLAAAVTSLTDTAHQELPALREELIGRNTEAHLQGIVLSLLGLVEARARRTTRGVLDDVGAGLHDDVLSSRTEQRLNELLVSLGHTARGEMRLARDDVLSAETDRALRVIVATAMDEVVVASERIRQKAHDELSFVQKNANLSLAIAGAVGALIAFFIWRQKEKNQLLLRLLAAQVHAQSGDREQQIYATLEEQAKQLGVAAQLRHFLGSKRRPEG